MGQRRDDTDVFPVLTFWYGLSFEELADMPNWALDLYARKLPELIADYQSLLMAAASFPHLKPEARKRMQRKLLNAQRPMDKRPKLSRDALRARMTVLGMGWEDVTPKTGEEAE